MSETPPSSRREAREARRRERVEQSTKLSGAPNPNATPTDFDTEDKQNRRSRRRSRLGSLGVLGKVLAGVLLVGVVAIIGSYTFLPPVVESLTGWAIQRNLGLDEEPGVKLKSEPPPKILTGDFSEGRVDMGGLDLGGVKPDRLRIDLDPFDVNVLRSAASGSLRAEKPLSGSMRVEFSEKAVAQIARSRVEQFPVTGVELSPNLILVSSEAKALGFSLPVSVEGGLKVRGGEMIFTPRKVMAFGVPIPKRIADSLLDGTDFTYPLKGLPYDAKIDTVRIEDKRLILTGKIKDIPVGNPGG